MNASWRRLLLALFCGLFLLSTFSNTCAFAQEDEGDEVAEAEGSGERKFAMDGFSDEQEGAIAETQETFEFQAEVN